MNVLQLVGASRVGGGPRHRAPLRPARPLGARRRQRRLPPVRLPLAAAQPPRTDRQRRAQRAAAGEPGQLGPRPAHLDRGGRPGRRRRRPGHAGRAAQLRARRLPEHADPGPVAGGHRPGRAPEIRRAPPERHAPAGTDLGCAPRTGRRRPPDHAAGRGRRPDRRLARAPAPGRRQPVRPAQDQTQRAGDRRQRRPPPGSADGGGRLRPGRGRTAAVAFDSTWHWQMEGHGDTLRRFWRQLVLWLAQKDDTEGDRVWVRLDQRRYRRGSRVEFSFGANDDQGQPLPRRRDPGNRPPARRRDHRGQRRPTRRGLCGHFPRFVRPGRLQGSGPCNRWRGGTARGGGPVHRARRRHRTRPARRPSPP